MGISLEQNNKPFNGFSLKNKVTLTNAVTIITGKNGSGKTRLLQSINEGFASAEIDEAILQRPSISYLTSEQFNANAGQVYDELSNEQFKKMLITAYNRMKEKGDFQNFHPISDGRHNHIDPSQVKEIFHSISELSEKPITELHPSDIHLFAKKPAQYSLGVSSLSQCFLEYKKAEFTNELNHFKSTKSKGENLFTYLSCDEFYHKFGPKPWDVFNDILSNTMGLDLYVIEPDLDDIATHQTMLYKKGVDQPFLLSHLSSGEKCIFWVAINFFNISMFSGKFNVPRLLLLDEPDAHLHPMLCQSLLDALYKLNENYTTTFILTTHSPTTVALSQNGSTYILEQFSLNKSTKDESISHLLKGVNHLSISDSNRKQVFVESYVDQYIYTKIYECLNLKYSFLVDYISLSFIPSGKKMNDEDLRTKIVQHMPEVNLEKLNVAIDELLGIGNCTMVKQTVKELRVKGADDIVGIIDWDLTNKDSDGIFVISKNKSYAMDNLIFNPYLFTLYLLTQHSEQFDVKNSLADDFNINEYLNNHDYAQSLIDKLQSFVTGIDEDDKFLINFINNKTYDLSYNYMKTKGHILEEKIKEKFRFLQSAKFNKEGELKKDVLIKTMPIVKCDLLPKCFVDIFRGIQALG